MLNHSIAFTHVENTGLSDDNLTALSTALGVKPSEYGVYSDGDLEWIRIAIG